VISNIDALKRDLVRRGFCECAILGTLLEEVESAVVVAHSEVLKAITVPIQRRRAGVISNIDALKRDLVRRGFCECAILGTVEEVVESTVVVAHNEVLKAITVPIQRRRAGVISNTNALKKRVLVRRGLCERAILVGSLKPSPSQSSAAELNSHPTSMP